MIDTSNILAEIQKKKQQNARILAATQQELDGLSQQLADAEFRLDSTTKSLKSVETESRIKNDTLLSIKAEKDAELNRLRSDITTGDIHLVSLKATLGALEENNAQLLSDLTATADTVSAILEEPVAILTDTFSKIKELRETTTSVQDLDGMHRLIDTNKDSIIVIEGADGQLHTIDNRNQSSITEDSFKSGAVLPFKFVMPVKPMQGRHKGEVYSLEGMMSMMERYSEWMSELLKKGIIVEQKYDGARVQIHKKDNEITCWTTGHHEVSEKMPSLIASLKEIPHDFVAEGEVELYEGGVHQHRSKASGLLNRNVAAPEESDLELAVFDILWLNGTDIHMMDYAVRSSKLSIFGNRSKKITVPGQTIVNTKKSLMSAVKSAAELPGSEGAMLKLPSYKYDLDGKTTGMIKYKSEKSLDVKITGTHQVARGTGTYTYDCAVEGTNGEDVFIGTTFNTTVTSTTGIIKVAFTNLVEYVDPDTQQIHFRWIFPRVIEGREDKTKPDNTITARDLVQEMGNVKTERKHPSSRAVTDAARCTPAEKVPPKDSMAVDFKLQRQTFLPDSEDPQSEYHLILQMPTKYVDIVSPIMPVDMPQFDATVDHLPNKMRWNTAGIISPKHSLNTTRKIPSQIDVIDRGTAHVILGNSSYSLEFELDGELMTSKINAKRRGTATNKWDITQR